jgi:peptidoglycan/LPS O-acetylase OafA/YrhL
MESIRERRIVSLDGLRGLAILMVMLFHFGQFRFGWTGVDLFFVLSGFLITGILLDTRDAQNYFGAFYMRRLLRIAPLYYFSLLVIFFAFRPEGLPWYALYAQNWLSLSIPEATHFWSLAVEEQFYLVWPCVVYMCGAERVVLRISAAGIVASNGLRFALLSHVSHGVVYTNPFTRMDALLWGAACACLLRKPAWVDRLRPHAGWMPLLTLAAFAIWRFSPVIGPPVNVTIQRLGYPAISFSFAALLVSVVLTAEGRSWIQWFLDSSPMRAMGKYSYAAYIWQLLVLEQVHRIEESVLQRRLPALLDVLILMAATLAVSIATYALIERPFLALKRRFEPRYAPALQPASREVIA